MKVLITGASGFVGPHVVASLQRLCDQLDTVLTAKEGSKHRLLGEVDALDVTDRSAVDAAISRFAPACILHLAGIAAPAAASADARSAWRVHVEGTLNLAYSILANAPQCALLFVGSGLVYGATANTKQALDEKAILDPIDEYGVTKAAADLALGALARRGLRCVRIRPFNHTGSGQDEAFFVPGVAMQIARIERKLQPPVIRVGNLDAERDVLDVRDVAQAYALAVKNADSLAPGTIMNIASGMGHRVGDLLDRLILLSRSKISVEQDPLRMRPSDLPRLIGNADLARRLLGWSPEYDIEDTLATVLADCRARVASST